MSPNEFDRATSRMPKLSDHNREAARRVLVDGERLTDVALAHGMPKSRLSRCVARVLNRWQSYRREPVAWVTVTLTVPVALAKRFKRMAREARVAEPKRAPGRPVPDPQIPDREVVL
jgi:hypothetical protein